MAPAQDHSTLHMCPESRRSSTSSASVTASTSSLSNPAAEVNPNMDTSVFVSQNPKHPLPAYARDYPKPIGELDIDEALNRKPGRWSFRGTVERSVNRGRRPFAQEMEDESTRAAACAEAKKELLEAAAQMNAAQHKQ